MSQTSRPKKVLGNCLSFFAAITFSVLSAELVTAGTEVVRDPSSWDFSNLLYADIVVQGTVVSASMVEVNDSDLWSELTPRNDQVALLRVSLEISEVLRGPNVDSMWSFLVWDDDDGLRSFYQSGREVIVCAYFHPRLGIYYQSSPYGRYWKAESTWQSQTTPRGHRSFEDDDIRGRVMSMDLVETARAAELVVDGVVQSVVMEDLAGPDGSSAELVRLTMSIVRVLKGKTPGESITVVAITRGLYMPVWRAHVPRNFEVGQRWLCFLKRGEVGWYPFAGTNGLLRAELDTYIYDERVPYWRSMKNVEKIVYDAEAAEYKR